MNTTRFVSFRPGSAGAAIGVLMLSGPAFAAPTLQITGSCPGLTDVTVYNATPNGNVHFIASRAGGNFVVPGGPCRNTELGLGGDVKLKMTKRASFAGTTHVLALFSASECDYVVQILDEESCTTSFVQPISPYAWSGYYKVSDGPPRNTNPPTYTCLEACAQIYGGAPSDYQCSVSPVNEYHNAYASTFAFAGCGPYGEDYKLNTNYDCGNPGCSTSAFVADNCTLFNYCMPAVP